MDQSVNITVVRLQWEPYLSDVVATCVSQTSSLEQVCDQISPGADLLTMFSKWLFFLALLLNGLNEITCNVNVMY